MWITLLGFDRDKKDKGVKELIDRMGFVPNGVSLFLFHPDIIHMHDGMETERVLPPDNCSYYAIPYNEERAIQDWTNHDLRDLVKNLNKTGISTYIGIMGSNLENAFHDEWGNKHPETKFFARTKKAELNVLKRFKDGTYYEDFFADKLCQVLTDYDLEGIHLTDNFCPPSITTHDGDFSRDMIEQFISHTNISLPQDIEESLSSDEFDALNLRGDWIWKNHRQQWIEFLSWRWGEFFKKICKRVHEINKKVMVLGTYCTSPFETLYCLGIDLKTLYNAGVDYFMPNPAPGSSLVKTGRRYRFHQYMAMTPLISAFIPDSKSLYMLSIKDSSEEWDFIHYIPSFVERVINTLSSYYYNNGTNLKRSIQGYMLCLGDALTGEEWGWLRERLEVALSDVTPQKIFAPTLVWSDKGYENLLPSYIADRRWTVHKFVYEMARNNSYTGATIRIENLDKAEGPLFVPNFDLLSEEEKHQIASYKKGPVVCTASAQNGLDIKKYNINADIYFEDLHSDYKHCAFAFNYPNDNEDEILKLLNLDEVSDDLNEPFETEESTYTLTNTLPFVKVSTGFTKACAMLLNSANDCIFKSDHPILCMQLDESRIRVYSMNENRLTFARANISSKKPIKEVVNVTKFPVLSVKYIENPTDTAGFIAKNITNKKYAFSAKLSPGGLSIFDVTLED